MKSRTVRSEPINKYNVNTQANSWTDNRRNFNLASQNESLEESAIEPPVMGVRTEVEFFCSFKN